MPLPYVDRKCQTADLVRPAFSQDVQPGSTLSVVDYNLTQKACPSGAFQMVQD